MLQSAHLIYGSRMATIRRLPKDLAEKIAAGEVVERPASVVKELVENALDAGSSHIVVDLEEGGVKLISVADDGEGIAPDDLSLVFERHTTSKIATLDDLFAVKTLGFRGEALASIAAVSRAEIISAREGLPGARLEVAGGVLGELRPEGCPRGTTIRVRDLFFNTPARRKFLKKESTELGHITSLIQNLAMAYPGVHFELTHNRRKMFALPAVGELRERVAGFFGLDVARDLLEMSWEGEGLKLRALLAPRQHTRANTRAQFIFVNRRYVRDSLLVGAVTHAYRGFIESGRYPVAFLFIEIDPTEVDVNVHPAKLEIRFRNSSQVYSTIMTALRAELEKSWPRAEVPADAGTLDERRARITQKIGDFFLSADRSSTQAPLFQGAGPGAAQGPAGAGAGAFSPPMLPVHGLMQIHNSYIVEETAQGFRISDQHALHERVLFKEISERLRDSKIAAQQLLSAMVIQVTEQDVLMVEEHGSLFDRVGLEVRAAGPRTLAINAIPQVLGADEAPALVRDVLDRLEEENEDKSFEQRLEEVAAALACRAAVKAGQALSNPELESLIRRANEAKVQETCPHGRPTTLYFSIDDLEKRFGRK